MNDTHHEIQNHLSDKSCEWQCKEKYGKNVRNTFVNLEVLVDDKCQGRHRHN
jgi:hypothetical protein